MESYQEMCLCHWRYEKIDGDSSFKHEADMEVPKTCILSSGQQECWLQKDYQWLAVNTEKNPEFILELNND